MAQWPELDPATPMSFGFDNAYRQGWRTFKERYGFLLGIFWLYIAVNLGIGIVVGAIDEVIGFPLVQLLMTVFVDGPLTAGFAYAGVCAVRREFPGVGILFAGFGRYWQCVGVYLVVAVLAGAIIGVFAVAIGIVAAIGGPLGMLGIVILVAAGICTFVVIQVRLSFALTLAIDDHAAVKGVLDAVSTSWAITGPRFWSLFGLGLTLALICMGTGVLLLLPLLFFGMQLMMAVWASAYVQCVHDAGVAGPLNRCPRCGYEITASRHKGICPECGTSLS